MSQPNKYVSLPQEAHRSQERANADDVIEDDIPLQDLAEIDNLDFESGLQQEPDLESLSENQEGSGTSNMKMAFMNMANSILGAGIIGQPFAFKNSGVLGGTLIMFFLTGLIDWTLRLIVVNAQLSQTRSYQDTVFYCYGKWGKILLLFSISSFAYGGCMAFCVIIGDTIPHVLKSALPDSWTDPSTSIIGWMFGRNVIITIFTACISYPLSLNRDISKLAKASGFALLGMIIIVIVTVARGPMVDDSLKSSLSKGSGLSALTFSKVSQSSRLHLSVTTTQFSFTTH
ncbi:uncharacterized protein CXQ87_000725 [Candidozyma duobushaemuli]|uniref:Amino acid transporter transmembrane domain-containing protein n=1 Tax=Candidozyma duobushaemuli TaxID=1231522 RepID=A0A2V1AHN1_9ASCO|nr:uncharacterized protein CXQ87_000725 [[Candida] duobushaemulonis]PVH17827.1 hypothetical protein CXQ87_000725 [[Candida] duobushaemulonis]